MPPTYRNGANDADGNEFLYHASLNDVVDLAETSGWDDPTNNNHYGAGRNGRFYANGVLCEPGPLSVSGSVLEKNWRRADQEPFRVVYDGVVSPGTVTAVGDNTLDVNSGSPNPKPGWWWFTGVDSWGKWYLQGDFDISIDFSNISFTALSHVNICVWSNQDGTDGTNEICMKYYFYGAWIFQGHRFNNGAISYFGGNVGASITDGGVRIARVNTSTTPTFRCYRKLSIGGGWIQQGSDYTTSNIGDGDVCVAVMLTTNGATNASCRITNFQHSEDSWTNKAGWAREAFGSHRGYQDEMPSGGCAVATDESIDIIDNDNTKLWKRAYKNSGTLLGPNIVAIKNVVFRDGVMIAVVNWQAGLYRTFLIDFTADLAILFSSEGPAGAFMTDTENRVAGLGIWNSGIGGWTGSLSADSAFLISGSTNQSFADIWFDSGKEYDAIAFGAGLKIFRHTRWHTRTSPRIESTNSSETSAMLSCVFDQDDGEVFYMSSTTAYSASKATWEAGIGGTFSSSTSKALPGTQSQSSQQRLKRYSSYLFIAADEGIYRVDWPSGSWQLFYADSGGQHDILPSYDRVSGIDVQEDTLLATLVDGTDYKVVDIYMPTHGAADQDVTATFGAEALVISGA